MVACRLKVHGRLCKGRSPSIGNTSQGELAGILLALRPTGSEMPECCTCDAVAPPRMATTAGDAADRVEVADGIDPADAEWWTAHLAETPR